MMIHEYIENQRHLYIKETNCYYFKVYPGHSVSSDNIFFVHATNAGKVPKADIGIYTLDSAPEFIYNRLKEFFKTMPVIQKFSFKDFCPNCEFNTLDKEIKVTGIKLNYCFLCGKKLKGRF